MQNIRIHPTQTGLELEPDLVATFNRHTLKQEGEADVWLDILPTLVGPQDVAASQAHGLQHTLQELLLMVAQELPAAKVGVDAQGAVTIYTS